MLKTTSEGGVDKQAWALTSKYPWVSRRGWLVLGLALLVHLGYWWIAEPPTLFSDFYKAYFPAGEYLWEDGLTAPWPFTESGAGGFVNLPILAWLFIPFVPMGEDAAGWVFLALGAAAVVVLTLLLVRLSDAVLHPAVPVSIAVLVALNGPMANSLREGNSTHFVLLMMVTSLLLLRRERDLAAGAVLGVCAIIKLPLLLLLGYFVWRREWSVLSGAALALAGLGAVSLAVFGIATHVAWFTTCVVPFLNGVIPAFNVQSIDGFIMRLDTGASRLREWDPVARPAVQAIIRLVIMVGLAAAAYLAFRRPSRNAAVGGRLSVRDREVEIAVVMLLAIITSPVSWTHYYIVALVPWALMIGPLLSGAVTKLQRCLIIASMVLVSLPVVDVPEGLAPWLREALARTVISAWLFGGLALLVALLIERWNGREPVAAGAGEDSPAAEIAA